MALRPEPEALNRLGIQVGVELEQRLQCQLRKFGALALRGCGFGFRFRALKIRFLEDCR